MEGFRVAHTPRLEEAPAGFLPAQTILRQAAIPFCKKTQRTGKVHSPKMRQGIKNGIPKSQGLHLPQNNDTVTPFLSVVKCTQ